ncbi:MAG: hypothetical protein R2791_05045 [Saprospiraceae bacterium]
MLFYAIVDSKLEFSYVTNRPYGNPDFAKSEAGKAIRRLAESPDEGGASLVLRRRRFQAKSLDFHKALIFWFFFIKKKEQHDSPIGMIHKM